MNCMICTRGKEEDIKFLEILEKSNMGLELGSYGLEGVKSERVWQKKIAVCLDVGHVNVFSPLASKKWIKVLGKTLTHMHIHDNCGKQDKHLPVGSGKINFKDIFKALKKYNPDCTVSLEITGDMKTKIENMRYVIKNYGF